MPVLVHFPPSTTGGGLQHADVSIGQDGEIAVANTAGLLLHDGSGWRVHSLPNSTSVRSVEWVGRKLFVGGQGAFGYFARSHIHWGPYQYVDLTARLVQAVGPFEDVWRTVPIPGGVVLSGATFVAECTEQGSVRRIFSGPVENLLPFGEHWVFQTGNRLRTLSGEAIGPPMPASWRAEALVLSAENSWTLLTHAHGVHRASSASSGWQDLPGEIDRDLRTSRTNCILRTESGWLIGTSDGGILLTSDFERRTGRIGGAQGLARETVLALGKDALGNVWAGLEGGLDFLAFADPERNPFQLLGRSSAGYGSLHTPSFRYFATSQGCEAWSAAGGRTTVIPGQSWSVQRAGSSILLGHHSGLYELRGTSAMPVWTQTGVWGVWPVPGTSSWIAGTYSGLLLLRDTGSGWKVIRELEGFDESARHVAVEDATHIWVTHPYKGAWRIRLQPDAAGIAEVQHMGREEGFQDSLNLRVHALDDQIVFTASRGLLRWNAPAQRVEAIEEFADGLDPNAPFTHVASAPDGSVWYFTPGHVGRIAPTTAGLRPGSGTAHLPLHGAEPISRFEHIEFMPDGRVCIPTTVGFLVVEPEKMLSSTDAPRVVIHRIAHLNAAAEERRIHFPEQVELESGIHALQLALGTEGNRWLGRVMYQWRFPEVSDVWSEPVKATALTLPGLGTGDHELELRAVLSPAFTGPITRLLIEVPAPWYASTLARIAYLLAAIGSAAAGVWAARRRERLRTARELADAQAALTHEREERARTELELRNQELASATLHLMEKGEALQTVRKGLVSLRAEVPRSQQKSIQDLIHVIQQDERFDAGWEQFSQQFDRVHVDFQTRLRERFPHLTKNDLRLCAYIRMNLSSKEIAALMFVSVRAVEISRFRLRKRLDLDKGANLQEFIQRL
ncbi:MAG: hypothetical protein RLZZ275_535 [Bacteroidota bacterium]